MFPPILITLLLFISPSLQAPTPQSGDVSAAASNSSSSSGTTCSAAVAALAQGIKANIAVQNNEVAAVSSLGAMLNESPVDTTLFAAGQASLLGFVKQGIAVRQNNQAITPAGSSAIAGLATVAMAQMTELNLTMGLGMGGVDIARDNATVKSLIGDFKGGIEQNGKNLQAAMGNCTMAAGAGSAAPSGTSGGAGSAKPTASAKPAKIVDTRLRR